MPKRLQRKRTKGWRMSPNGVSVTRPGPYGNPFMVIPKAPQWARRKAIRERWPRTRKEAAERFLAYVLGRLSVDPDWLEPLRGKDLYCFCAEDEPHCHADILLELANRDRGSTG